jgi:hypothetical protein
MNWPGIETGPPAELGDLQPGPWNVNVGFGVGKWGLWVGYL